MKPSLSLSISLSFSLSLKGPNSFFSGIKGDPSNHSKSFFAEGFIESVVGDLTLELQLLLLLRLQQFPKMVSAYAFRIFHRDGFQSGKWNTPTFVKEIYFFLNGTSPASFLIYFRLFKPTLKLFDNKYMWKCTSSIPFWNSNPWPSEYESPPITTRPGLKFFDKSNI